MWLWAVADRFNSSSGPRGGREDQHGDQQAIGRVAAGDRDALADLYDRHSRAVFSLALRIVQDWSEAEDVVQEVFSQAWSQAARHDPARGAVAAWLLTIARSRAIDRVRHRRARPDSAGEQAVAAWPDPAPLQDLALLADEQIARVRAAVTRLPFLQRIALELAYFEGLTQSEIAERLEQPLGTVKTRIRQALIKLRESLGGAEA